ncbi:MAG: metal-dependent transcriptional regulator, partial [Acidimicrobiaceae bacterium]
MHANTEHHPAFEEYCECIFELEEDNVELIQARIAERLSVSRASVSEMIKRMEAEGLISLSGPRIALTEQGRKLAEGIVRKHRLAECFLIDVLGLSWSTAHHEACK